MNAQQIFLKVIHLQKKRKVVNKEIEMLDMPQIEG